MGLRRVNVAICEEKMSFVAVGGCRQLDALPSSFVM
jgi:hypothetical protein